MIFVNFKTYKQGTGQGAIELAKICQQVAKETSVKIFPVVQAVDIYRVAKEVGIEAWSQHVDDVEYGPNTGQILPEAIKAAGAAGTILNHSENKLPVEVVNKIVTRCQQLALKTLVCCENLSEGKELAAAKPDFLAYEPPELIGSQMASVAAVRPEVVKSFTNQITQVPILVGAGIHSQEDVQKSLESEAKGILVASDIVLAVDSQKELLELAHAFKNG